MLAQHPGHRADADLQRRAVGDELLGDHPADRRDISRFLFAGLRQIDHRQLDSAFDEVVDLRNMNRVVAADANRILVDLRDHQIGVAREQLRHDLRFAEVAVAVLVGRRHGHQVHVEIIERGRQMPGAVIHDRREVGGAAMVNRAVVRRQIHRLEAEALAQPRQIPVHDGGAVIDDDVFEFHQAARERGAQLERRLLRDRQTDAVARLDMRDGFIGRDQLGAQLRAPIVSVHAVAILTRCGSHLRRQRRAWC